MSQLGGECVKTKELTEAKLLLKADTNEDQTQHIGEEMKDTSV